MKDEKQRRATWKQLALQNGFANSPPGGRGRGAAATPSREPTLTEKFNHAANPPQQSSVVVEPATKKQVEELRKQMSQPRATFEMTPLGSVNRARNPEKDRLLVQTMTALTERLGKQKGLKQRFALAEKKGQLKQAFNRSPNGMSM